MWGWFPPGGFYQFYFIAVRTRNGRPTPLTGLPGRSSPRLTVGARSCSRWLALSWLASRNLYSR